MKIERILGLTALCAVLAACGGDDDNGDGGSSSSSSSSSSVAQNACASYEVDGATRQGTMDGDNCVYDSEFIGIQTPFTGDELVFEALENNGIHMFEDSVVIGTNYDNDADLEAAGIAQGGDGSTLRIAAGVRFAFNSEDDYMVINRGSQIFAEGTADAPIIFSSISDLVDEDVGPEDVQEWGGMVINGFGITNKCAYTGSFDEDNLETSDCHVLMEGKEGAGTSHYGGNNNEDNSGVLKYVVVKHTGAEVSPDNELNGIAFGGVGSGTEVDYLQVYSTYDDGIEMFGGAVNFSHFVAINVRDDSIDIDEGYRGTIDYALVIQSEQDGANCMESDGLGSYDSLGEEGNPTAAAKIAQGLNSQPVIRNLTCIVSPNAMGTHDPGVGLRIREAHFPTIENSIVTTAYGADAAEATNYCIRLEHEGLQAAQDGDLVIEESIFACHDLTNDGSLPNGTTVAAWLEEGNDVMQVAATGNNPSSSDSLRILNGFYSLPIGDMVVNSNSATVTPTQGRTFIGAVTEDEDWTAGWTYGLHDGSRGQALWFE